MGDAPVIVIRDTADPTDVAELRARVEQFNVATTGYDDGRSLSCFLRDAQGTLVAGVDGFTWGGYAKIEWLWVTAARRGQGLGRRLVEAAEQAAAARGCSTIVLDTHDFQAPDFYRSLGYVLVGTTHDTPRGHRQFLFQKEMTHDRSRRVSPGRRGT